MYHRDSNLVMTVLLFSYYDARSTSAVATSKHLAAFCLILIVLQFAGLTVKTMGGQFVFVY
jgi:hypothetical protein